MPNSNLEQLIATAALLRPMLGDLVFVGGAVTSLLVTDEGAGAPRPTLDVDAIAEITSYAEYAAFGERLRALGFSEDASERHYAGGFIRERSSTSCPWMRRFSDSPIAGIVPLWKPRPYTSCFGTWRSGL